MSRTAVVRRIVTASAAVALGSMTLLAAPVAGSHRPGSPPPPRSDCSAAGPPSCFGQAGFDGGNRRVESVNVPARIARVGEVPGTDGNDAWALGQVTNYRTAEGWNGNDDGQLVLLRNRNKQGWVVIGPPLDGTTVVNPTMSAMAMAPNGDGWAVGQAGKMLHYRAGDSAWRLESLCPAVTCKTILAIALAPDGQSGYAVGADGLTLRLSNNTWTADVPVDAVGSLPATLVGLALTPAGDAWAIAGSSTDQNSRGIEIYKRGPSSWTAVQTGKNNLDNPLPTTEGGQVRFGVKGKAAVADGLGNVWFAGGLFPIDPANPLGNNDTGGTTERPFTLRLKGTTFTSYCPVVYTFSNDQVGEQAVCDQPMPMSAFDVTSLAALSDGQVFAGGFGLFHYRPTGTFGSWYREPDPIGLVGSLSFASDSEGWFTSAGDASGAQAATTSSIALGHYTDDPKPSPRLARWPLPTTTPIQTAAISPSGTYPPIAIGDGGITLTLTAEGWQRTGSGAAVSYTAAAYVGSTNVAWAVGEAGNFLRFQNGLADDRSAKFQTKPGRFENLFGVAFNAFGNGWAVGARGSLVHYDKDAADEKDKWTPDPGSGTVTTSTLYAVDAIGNGNGFVAVGDNATMLINTSGQPGDWEKVPSVATLLNASSKPWLYAVDTTSDGTIVAGGTRSSLIVGTSDGTFRLADHPPEGTIYSLQARKEGTTLKLVASLGPHRIAKYNGQSIGTTQAWLTSFDGITWRDLQNGNRSRLAEGLDYAGHPDAIVTIVAEPGGKSGWAVGGRPAGLVSLDDNSINDKTSTGSIYRFDLTGDPTSEFARDAVIQANTPTNGFGYSFAFFSDTSCGSTLCSLTIGTGTKADEVALRIRADINAAAARPGGPKFVLFGGSARGSGTREELAAFTGYLEGFDIPVFGAPGTRDLTIPTAGSATQPPALPYGLAYPTDVSNETRTVGSTRFYQEELARMPQPWGAAPKVDGFDIPDIPGAAQPAAGRARTHYAVDYRLPGTSTKVGRFIFVDTSTRTLSTTGQNPSESTTGQSAWLTQAIVDGRSNNIPTYVVMNVPPRDPLRNTTILPVGDVTTIENAVYGGGVTAVFAGNVRGNATYLTPGNIPGAVPFYIAGTGGAPPSGTQWSADGHYHSWLLATANAAGVNALAPQAHLEVRAIPVTDSIALVAPEGTVVNGGNILKFDAFARSIDGGNPSGDRGAANATYIKYPIQPPCEAPGEGAGSLNSVCFNRGGLTPDYQFVSDDPTIADFVLPLDPQQRTTPFRDSGRLVHNDKIGFLCSFRVGRTNIRIRAGGREAVMPITVRPGDGPCVDAPVVEPEELPGDVDPAVVPKKITPAPNPAPPKAKPAKVLTPAPPPKPAPVPPPPPPPEPTPIVKVVPKPFLIPHILPELTPALLPPAPSMIPSPAPPASASAAGAEKQEDKEVETESAGQEGGDFVAIGHRRSAQYDTATGLMLAAAAALLGVFGAAIAATKSAGRRPTPARAHVIYPRELR